MSKVDPHSSDGQDDYRNSLVCMLGDAIGGKSWIPWCRLTVTLLLVIVILVIVKTTGLV